MSFIWEIIHCFFIFFDTLCWFCTLEERATSPSSHGLASYRRPLLIIPARDSRGLSNFHASPKYFLCSLRTPCVYSMWSPMSVPRQVRRSQPVGKPPRKIQTLGVPFNSFPSQGKAGICFLFCFVFLFFSFLFFSFLFFSFLFFFCLFALC